MTTISLSKLCDHLGCERPLYAVRVTCPDCWTGASMLFFVAAPWHEYTCHGCGGFFFIRSETLRLYDFKKRRSFTPATTEEIL